MKTFIFSFLIMLGCFIQSISAQSDSLITELEKTLQMQIDSLGEEHLDVAMYCDSLGVMYMESGKFGQADSLFNKALEIKVKKLEENHPDIAVSYYNLGEMYDYTGNYIQANIFFTKALNIRLDVLGEKHPDMTKSYNSLGVVYWRIGNYEKAISFYNKALNIRLVLLGEKHLTVAKSYNNLGVLCNNTGDYKKAISFHNKAINIRLELLGEKHPMVAKSYNNLGNVYLSTGDYEKAIGFHNKAMNIRLELLGEKHPNVAMSYNNLGVLYNNTGDYKKAISFHNKALDIWLDVFEEKHPDVAMPYNNLGSAYWTIGDYEKAISFFNKALNIWLDVFGEKHAHLAHVYNSLGNVYNSTGDYEKATGFYNKALNIRLEVFGEEHPTIIGTYKNLANVHRETGNFKTADSLWQIAIPQNIQRLKSTYLFLSNAQRIKYSNTLSSMNTDFYSFAAINGTESTKQLATNFLLNTKSLALDYSISTNQLIKESNDTTLSTQYHQLNKLNKKIADAEKLTIEELKEKGWDLSEIQDQQEALAFQMLQHPQLKSKLNTETVEWQDIQNHLVSDEATVDFLRIYEKKDSLWAYYGIVIHKDLSSPQFIRIADEKTLTALLETDGQTHPNYLTKRYSRKALYKALWQPLVPHLEGMKTVHISPTNILYRVPFEALQNRKNKYLTTQYEFHYYSAIRDMLREKSRKMTYKNMVLLGHILYDTDGKEKYTKEQELYDTLFTRNTRDGIRPLKETLEEVTKINKLCKKAKLKTTMLTIDAASEDTVQYFVSERAPNIIHFATHGVFLSPLEKQHNKIDLAGTRDRLRAADNPLQRSALMLYGANETWTKGRPILGSGEDGILTALEVTALDLQNTDLVVLSACSTGLGDMHNTEGVFGLQRAFKLAGVRHVVASLWDVDDGATKELMVKFYKNLLQHKQGPTTALRNAKDELREAGYEPQDWAGFILIE